MLTPMLAAMHPMADTPAPNPARHQARHQASDQASDQAGGLRRLTGAVPVHVIAVTGGKGGVGKTHVAVNLALALCQSGRQVMLLDADLGLANVDVLLGVQPRYNLSHVLAGERHLDEIVVTGPEGLLIVPAASGVSRMAAVGSAELIGLIRAFSELSFAIDVLIIDTAAGIAESVLSLCRAAHEVITVVCDEPASITDAYALIKLLAREQGVTRFRALANMVESTAAGYALHAKLSRVTERFLDVTLDYIGAVPYDDAVRRAAQRQQAVVTAYPRSRAATAFRHMADKAGQWPVPRHPTGHVQFFVERLITASCGLPGTGTPGRAHSESTP